jgi:hypothetical protein
MTAEISTKRTERAMKMVSRLDGVIRHQNPSSAVECVMQTS